MAVAWLWSSLLLDLLVLSSSVYSFSFKNVTSDFFVSPVPNGILAAFGDFNSDKKTDMFFITENGTKIEIYLVHNEKEKLSKNVSLNCTFDDSIITSIVPGDYNGDSKMDVLITLKRLDQDENSETVQFRILPGNINYLSCKSNAITQMGSMRGQPLVLDYNGDMIPDLYGEAVDGTRQWWNMSKEWLANRVVINASSKRNRIRKIHSNAFLDLNGDLVSDVFVTIEENKENKSFEIWRNKNGEYPEFKTVKFPNASVIGQSAFLDINLDGKLDHIVPVCFNIACTNASIFVHFNESRWVPVIGSLQTEELGWGFFYNETFPITLRIGDVNLDGYPDLLAILYHNESVREVMVLENSHCHGCQYQRKFSLKRYFKGITDVVLAVFYDIYQDGSLDFIFIGKTETGYQISAFQNEIESDVCFIKVLVLSGLCYLKCPNLKNKPYGVNQPGPSISYRTTTIDGYEQKSCAAQLSQSAHFSLQLPYTVFGLGQTPNFVDLLSVGIPRTRKSGNYNHNWTSVIPNSQMIVIPYRNEKENEIKIEIHWYYNLFVTPSHQVLLTFIALAATCVIIVLIIGGLHWKEKIADKRERLQEAHRFNFDAM